MSHMVLRLGVGMLVWFCTLCPAQQPPAKPDAAPSPDGDPAYVGADTCHACHEDPYANLASTAHKKLLTGKDADRQGCEACHGPGAAHVNGNGDASKIVRFQELKPAAVRARCTACHQAAGHDVGAHSQLSCLSCHAVHHYRQVTYILAKPSLALCRSCHN